MALYQWINADGNGAFGDPYNWINETSSPPMNGVPGADDTAVFNSAGTLSGTGTVAALVFAPASGLLTSNGMQIVADQMVMDGSVALTDETTFDVANEFEVSGPTTVTVTQGSLIDVNDAVARTTTPYVVVGFDVGAAASYNSTLNLAGVDTQVYVAAEEVIIGDEGNGAMTISNGAELDAIDTAGFNFGFYAAPVILGNDSGVQGSLTLTGVGSRLVADDPLIVGFNGNGHLVVEAGAELQFDPEGTPLNDALVVGGYYGTDSNSTGTVLVTGAGSRLTAPQNTYSWIGFAGAGTLTVANGAFVELGNVEIGEGPVDPSSGTVLVENAGSALEVRGYLDVGGSGPGSVSITAGAEIVMDSTSFLTVGDLHPASVTVSGSGSTLNCSASPFFIGVGDTGKLVVSAGGTVLSGAYGAQPAVTLGDETSSTGHALVTGSGSIWTIAGELLVGDSGTGTVSVSADGKVTAATLVTSVQAAAGISVSTGAELQVSGNVQLGGSARTAVSIGAGSVLSSSATISVTDAGISLGGGTLSATRSLKLSPNQTISGTGTIQAAAFNNAGLVTGSAGTLSFIGGLTGGGTVKLAAGATVSLSGAVGATEHLAFSAATGTLVLGAPSQVQAQIADFVKGDVIDLKGIVASSLTYSGQALTVHETNGSSIQLQFSGTYTTASFAPPGSDGHGGTLITHS